MAGAQPVLRLLGGSLFSAATLRPRLHVFKVAAPMTAANTHSATLPTPSPRTGIGRISQTQWVLIAMIVGVAVGYFFPDGPNAKGFHATDLQVLSTVFLRMIKSLIVPLLFATLVVGIAGHGDDMKRVGKLAFRSIVYFEIVTTLALVVGLARGEHREARASA